MLEQQGASEAERMVELWLQYRQTQRPRRQHPGCSRKAGDLVTAAGDAAVRGPGERPPGRASRWTTPLVGAGTPGCWGSPATLDTPGKQSQAAPAL